MLVEVYADVDPEDILEGLSDDEIAEYMTPKGQDRYFRGGDNVVEYITELPELGFEFWKLQQQLERAGWKLERLS